MSDQNCENCTFHAKYDNNPKSFLGRLWKWHTSWCPGWKSYMSSLPSTDRINLAGKYEMKKYM